MEAKAVTGHRPRTVAFRAFFDDEVHVWVATSDDRITTEAATKEALLDRLAAIVPDVLESRDEASSPLNITVDWQELRTVDRTEIAVARRA